MGDCGLDWSSFWSDEGMEVCIHGSSIPDVRGAAAVAEAGR